MPMQIKNGDKQDAVKGGIYMTPEILKEFQDLVGEQNAKLLEMAE